ncbi:ABC transporter ATP-binding protein [Schaalia georgiae]|nr:ABC transporter ATP-binding protein [Schaalia georgiae]
MTPSAPIIHIEHLTKAYRGRPALVGLDLDLHPGRIVGLVGPNGCGKTTLLKILAGVLADWTGAVAIDGIAPGVETKRRVAFLPSAAFLDPALTPGAAVRLYSRFFEDFDADKAMSSIRFFDLPLDRTLKEMSKGMGEKLQISLTMARKARLYLLDEPISGVDPAARDIILEGILRDFDEDALMLISTHLISDIESILDEVVMLKEGRLHRAGPVDDLRDEYGMSLDALFRKEYR